METRTLEGIFEKISKDRHLNYSEIKKFYAEKQANLKALTETTERSGIKILNLPKGYNENFYQWDRKADVLLVLFVASNDPLGISIEGVQSGDIVTIESLSGLASFSEETDWGNVIGRSLTAVLATGAKIGSAALGHPEFEPLIKAGEKFMQNQFKDEKMAAKIRDAFGVDPGSQHKARQEGGILVCLPGNVGASYSSNDKKYWIKEPGDRTDNAIPPQIEDGFFVRRSRSHNSREVKIKGQVVILAWDHKFKDNVGYYKMAIRLEVGEPDPIVVD